MHFCPSCGQACDCHGDIEDHDTGEEFVAACECCDHYSIGVPDDAEDDDMPHHFNRPLPGEGANHEHH